MHPSVENRFYDLLGCKMTGDIQASELEELESILQRHPELQFFYNQILSHSAEVSAVDIETAWLSHRTKMTNAALEPDKSGEGVVVPGRHYVVKRILAWALVAASVILIVGVTWRSAKRSKAPDRSQTIVATDTHKGSRSTMTLPDGSIVRLNARSKVSYGEGFGKTTREVFLTGEAYFEVTHNAAIPFIVHTDEADIKVLGTKFNVRNYSNEHRMEAALLTGSIELTLRANTQHKILLKPSDKIIVKQDAADAIVQPAAGDKKVELTSIKVQDSVIVETSWLNDKMAFVDKPFSEIALDLERQFDVHIEFKNRAVSEYKYTGVYDEENAEEILKIFQMIKPFHYTLNNKQITIY